MMIQNLRDAAKAVLRGNFIVIQAYLRKQKQNKTKHLKPPKTLQLKQLKKKK